MKQSGPLLFVGLGEWGDQCYESNDDEDAYEDCDSLFDQAEDGTDHDGESYEKEEEKGDGSERSICGVT